MEISIKNFQSIKQVNVDIKGFTCLIGPSDIGKSAIVRAVSGLLNNSPATNLIRKGEETLEVSIDLTDEKITWTKGKGSKYKIGDIELEKLNRDVPQEFKDLNLLPIETEQGEKINLHIQEQFDDPFLDSQPRILAEIISRIGSLGTIKKAHNLISKDIKTLKKDVSDISDSEKAVKVEIDKLAPIKNIKQELDAIQLENEKINRAQEQLRLAKKLQEKRTRYKTLVSQLEHKIAILKDLPDIEGLEEKLKKITRVITIHQARESKFGVLKSLKGRLNTLQELQETQKQANALTKEFQEAAAIIEKTKNLSKRQISAKVLQEKISRIGDLPNTQELDLLISEKTKIQKIQKSQMNLTSKIMKTRDLEKKINNVKEALHKSQHQWDSVEVCPLCGD